MSEAVSELRDPPVVWRTLKLAVAVPMLAAAIAALAGLWEIDRGPQTVVAFYFVLIGIEMWRWPKAAAWFDPVSARILGPALTAIFAAVFALSLYQFVTE